MLHLTIHGRVQGVGFRIFVCRQADAAGLAGWVRNTADGRVEAVLDGPAAAIDTVRKALGAGPTLARVDRVEAREATADESAMATRPFGILPTRPDTAPGLPDAATIDAYRATDYFALEPAPAGRRRVRIDDPVEAHAGWLADRGARNATILTAWNPFGENLPAAANDQAQARLQAWLDDNGLRWLPASGEDPRGLWTPEPGYCAFDLAPARVDEALQAFRQNAVVRIGDGRPCRLVWHPAIRRHRPDLDGPGLVSGPAAR